MSGSGIDCTTTRLTAGQRFSIGGQISFDVFPHGWEKTGDDLSGVDYKSIHFFGDKCFEGGNDFEIYSDSRTIGHSVENPDDCMKQIRKLFDLESAGMRDSHPLNTQ